MMGLRNSFVLCLALMLSFSSAIHCIDITKTLGQYPEFTTFNKYLTETKLVEQINSAKAVTILAVEDKDLAFLSGKPIDDIKTVIGTNVITEFYDEKKLLEAIGSQVELPTLSPASGLAAKIKVQLINEGEVTFSSAVPGSKPDTFLVRTVTTEAEVVSVLKVDKPIVTVDASTTSGVTGTPSVAETPKSSVADAPAPSASSRATFGFIVAVMAFASIFVSL
ncbi:fasciclin-like arabinogalactan protein 3 [Trifolium pratense]|uniref:fasciclin-like arabinogalactan protein 3 n=1 Tax=Trifolium pratense TaxID=57577 RepID=UPI001E697F81|nr:fasciclin-like arabinogalactan protein 3 [Trifolium pratense]